MNHKKKNHYGKFYHKTPPLPQWVEELLDRPWTSASSLQVDRWLWYCQQEFEVKGGESDA